MQDIDAGVVLSDLPEMFQVYAENTTNNSLIYVTVRADKNRLAGIFGNGVFQGIARAILQVAVIFAVRVVHQPRTFILQRGYFGVSLFDFG